jgi:hypothetical protein
MNFALIVIILCLILLILVTIILITKRNNNEPFYYIDWNDIMQWADGFGGAMICKATSDCNSCGELGLNICAGCNPNPYDCLQSYQQFSTQNWCHHYFPSSDARNRTCPDITAGFSNLPAALQPTNWFCATKDDGSNLGVIKYTGNGEWKCKSLDATNCAPAEECCKMMTDYNAEAPASNEMITQAMKNLKNPGLPTSAVQLGNWKIVSNGNELIFNMQNYFDDNGNTWNGGLVASNNTMSWNPTLGDRSSLVNTNSFFDLPYGFMIGNWIVFTDVASNGGENKYLCFMYNTYASKPKGNRNVMALWPGVVVWDQPLVENGMTWMQVLNPMYNTNKDVDLVKILNADQHQLPALIIRDWVWMAQGQTFAIVNKNNPGVACNIVYSSSNDSYTQTFGAAPSSTNLQSALSSTPNVSIQYPSCASSSPQPMFVQYRAPRSEAAVCMQSPSGNLTCKECKDMNLSIQPFGACG